MSIVDLQIQPHYEENHKNITPFHWQTFLIDIHISRF